MQAVTESGRPMVPCGAMSPYDAMPARRQKQDVLLQVRCNRVAGHEGNHWHSTARAARVYEWTQKGVKVR